MILRSNEGKMVIYHKAVVSGYTKDVLFDKTARNNIFDLKNPIQNYIVTCDSLYKMFIVHREENNKPTM